MQSFEFLIKDISTLKGIGKKTSEFLRKKKINKIVDLLWNLPRSYTENIISSKTNELQIGKNHTIKINIKKYSFPRMRNLPFKVTCDDSFGEIDCVFFNSREGYIKKVLPLNGTAVIYGKINYFKKRYQIVNPKIISKENNVLNKIENIYSLTQGLTETVYKKIIQNVLSNLPHIDEWLNDKILKNFNYIKWSDAVSDIHKVSNIGNYKSNSYRRLVFDEILASFLISSQIRQNIKRKKKKIKFFNLKKFNKIISNLPYKLTKDQTKALNEINSDLNSKKKMFRLIQGDVGTGKTIVTLLSAINVIESGYQVALMAPTEILAKQHYELAKNLFDKKVSIELLTGKTDLKNKKRINELIKNNKVNLIIGTHSLFQKKIVFFNLGMIIIDEQHKFGVKQRKTLSEKGGNNCDILLLSATPIPRSLMMTVFGDLDISIIKQKPSNRKEVQTYSKSENKINDVINFAKKQILNNNQVFWVCPLIDESKKIDHQSAIKKYEYLKKIFHDQVDIIHGLVNEENKQKILKNFLNKKIKILVSTTVIEVGIDFPNANLVIIENANKFGLSQLHQLRGRVGRGNQQSYCILIFKNNLSENAKKRIKIMKSSTDGFKISKEDMKIRGYGDILGFKQSGIKNFKLADPILHSDLFELCEKEIKRIENEEPNLNKYKPLVKLYDQAEVIYDLS